MFKKKIFALSAATAAAGLSFSLSTAGVATAATPGPNLPNSSYGFDGNANLVVGGGSTTLYKIAQGFADLYNSSAGCTTNNSNYDAAASSGNTAYPQTGNGAFNQCLPTSQDYNGVSAGGNYDGDTVAIAASAGSSTGIASLNGSHSGTPGTYAYEGTNASIPTSGSDTNANGLSNGFGTVDFALSSRAAKTSGGNCNIANPTSGAAGDELQCDTFWGVAADGVEVFTWGSTVSGASDDTNLGSVTTGLTAADLYNIYTCAYTTWGQLPEYGTGGATWPAASAPIVPWSMNSNSGTYADFDNYVSGNDGSLGALTADVDDAEYTATNPGGSATSPTPPAGKCAREIVGTNPNPLENDIKPLLTDVEDNQGGLSQAPDSTNNPANWIWFGSYGLLTAYSYLSQPALFGNQYSTYAAPINGVLPSTSGIGAGTYPIPRILSLVTPKATADCPVSAGVCNLSGGPVNDNGTTDMNVTGATSGPAGAVREFVRFVCRDKAEQEFTNSNGTTSFSPTDPYTGTSDYTEIQDVITNSGFTLPPSADRSTGSDCDVQSVG